MRASRYRHGADEVVGHGVLPQATPDINITPMIDVLLVLLVIFMAALPLNQRGIDIELPPTTESTQAPPADSQIIVELMADKRVTLNARDVTLQALDGQLRSMFEGRQNKTVFIAAAGTLLYGEVVQVIDVARGAGAERIGLVTEEMRRAK